MTHHQLITSCSRLANTCPSRKNCHRHEMARSEDYPEAALNFRREPGASACDLVIWNDQPQSTFAVQQVAQAFGIDPDKLEEVTE